MLKNCPDRSPGSAISRKLVKTRRGTVAHKVALTERVLNAIGPVVALSVAEARKQMPQILRSAALGHIYLIGDARNDAPSAVLIGVESLHRLLGARRNSQTLREVWASLPFSGMKVAPLSAGTLPGSGLPSARLPK